MRRTKFCGNAKVVSRRLSALLARQIENKFFTKGYACIYGGEMACFQIVVAYNANKPINMFEFAVGARRTYMRAKRRNICFLKPNTSRVSFVSKGENYDTIQKNMRQV